MVRIVISGTKALDVYGQAVGGSRYMHYFAYIVYGLDKRILKNLGRRMAFEDFILSTAGRIPRVPCWLITGCFGMGASKH
jgi:hypothetical protein